MSEGTVVFNITEELIKLAAYVKQLASNLEVLMNRVDDLDAEVQYQRHNPDAQN